MKLSSLLLSASLLAAAISAHAKIERVVEKTFTVAPGGTLHVETEGGSIQVESSAEPVVKITARQKIRASSEAEADDILKKLVLTLEATGSNVNAIAKYERPAGGLRWGNLPVTVDFVVTVPTRFAVDLRTSGGNISVGDLDGKVNAHTSGGNVKLGKISQEIDAHTSGGDMEVAEGLAETRVRTSGGNIILGHLAGPTTATTSGGDIRAAKVAHTLDAKTSGGNVTATFAGKLQGDCTLSTSGGNVKVYVDPTIGFQLDASTSGGGVKADGMTITIDKGGMGKSRLAGAVNGGGSMLKLRSSGGDILILHR